MVKDNERCPVCGSRHIEGDSVDFFPGGAVQHVNCCSCGSDWNEIYRFEKREEIYDATKED